jgi:hypothetical protein
MSYIILRGRWCDVIVLNVHTPTEDKCDDTKDSFYEKLEGVFDQFQKYHVKILFGDFNAKVGREDIFKNTIGNDSLHETSNDNGVRIINFATSKNLVVKSTMFPHHKIHKYTWTSADSKTHNKTDHILVDRRQQSRIPDVQSFRGADCDADHYLVAAKLRERLLVSKLAAQKFDMQRFDLRKLSDAEVKEQYQVKTRNRFADLETFDDNVDMTRAWEYIRENIKTSAKDSLGHYELQQHKPWFNDECSKLIDRRKQAKFQWLQNQSQVIGDNMDNVRHEASRTFRTKRREYLKNKINDLETNSKNKNIGDLYRGINEFTKGYQPRTNMVKEENGDLLADSHSILNRRKNYFCQLSQCAWG